MTQQRHLRANPIKTPLLVGAALGLAIITFFVLTTHAPRPEWGKWWMVRPYIITPVAGAVAGALFSGIQQLLNQNRVAKIAGYAFGIVVFLFVLWIGTVVGLDGTLWD